jgi:L-ascorbate metabolism protein UlaG (beta-lactamase superfamily)
MQRLLGILLALLSFHVGCSSNRSSSDITVTNIGNAGFLVEGGHKKILIDAPFGGFESDWCYVPPDSVVNLMVNARPPFDDVDIIAYTHNHIDHFNPQMAVDHLLHNLKGIVICTGQTDRALARCDHYQEIRNRVKVVTIPMDSSATMIISGVEVKAVRTPHQPSGVTDTLTGKTIDGNRNLEHLEFLFTWDGNTIYHSGDASMDDRLRYGAFGFDAHRVDIAFVSWWDASPRLSFRQTLIRDIIKPERIVLSHIVKGPRPIDNPEWQAQVARQVILPESPLEQWTFRKSRDKISGEGKPD